MKITLQNRQERWSKNDAFCIATYRADKDENTLGPIVNIRISHEIWRRKTNQASIEGILEYIENHAEKFIYSKISDRTIQFDDKPSPVHSPQNYVIATSQYNPREDEILITLGEFECNKL